MTWLWIPITIAAALQQNIRTALQKHLEGRLSTSGATYTRYVFGAVFLGETVTGLGAVAIVLGTIGVMLMSLDRTQQPVRAFLFGWMERPARNEVIGVALLVGGIALVLNVRQCRQRIQP